jgi:DNA invertase Pin-like site-specific DNA recombinase
MNKRPNANVALCYVRMSIALNPSEEDSPERQRANIRAVCERNGWEMEWFEDVGGHRSGRSEKNRPEWQRLKSRLNDSNVVAVATNDLSRLHRKGWRASQLMEDLESKGVRLMICAPGRELDLSSPNGRLFAHFSAIIDEYYANDVSIRAKDSIRYRKSMGKTIGMPPFGTLRNENGFLIPSNEGAWLLPNGRFVAGVKDEPAPVNGSVWRGYYEAAREILTLYTKNNIGTDVIAYRMNDAGWAYRDRKGVPRPLTGDDIRRVIANWPEYGGVVLGSKATSRKAYESDEADFQLADGRAVFEIELLIDVAKVRKERSIRPKNRGVNRGVHHYALSGITYCAHCEALANEHNDATLRSTLSGASGNGLLRYRHKPGVSCGCTNRSVLCSDYEADFQRLLSLLTVDESALTLMTQLAMQASAGVLSQENQQHIEAQKADAIARCNRRIVNAKEMCLNGDISHADYREIKEKNEREISKWEAMTSEPDKLALELSSCLVAINGVRDAWNTGNAEDKRDFAQNLFEYVVYDLDTRRIVTFSLKAWAENYVGLRTALYAENKNTQAHQGLCTDTLHTGFEPVFSP